ncbi:MAG TPA: hypothetical protein VK681_12735 [Reyranella sp.]|nr:hypothetical protein [Reyranella sp.]
MPGQITIGGKAEGPTGQIDIGPSTMTGSSVVGAVETLELVSGDNAVPVPKGTTAAVVVFTADYEGGEVKLRTSLNPGDAGLPLTAQGYAVLPLAAGTTSLILHSSGSTSPVGVTFI